MRTVTSGGRSWFQSVITSPQNGQAVAVPAGQLCQIWWGWRGLPAGRTAAPPRFPPLGQHGCGSRRMERDTPSRPRGTAERDNYRLEVSTRCSRNRATSDWLDHVARDRDASTHEMTRQFLNRSIFESFNTGSIQGSHAMRAIARHTPLSPGHPAKLCVQLRQLLTACRLLAKITVITTRSRFFLRSVE
ncbi:hypothetical protein ACVIHI_002950 [Bradyrhizobium sp. USDA 4524]|nr:hypothetical protein [Bradyrhizobium sp. USDA 4538]MCP1904697.1 hypothetical protein [Bradyrhizobium sp. USDA 4537]MCP1989647.1 hypothetical protein [Bradyrhizobium sp. USDA 4539]